MPDPVDGAVVHWQLWQQSPISGRALAGENLVHFFATDAHDTKHRPPLLSPCYEKVAATCGAETADRLLIRNPEAVINDMPLPKGPEPLKSRRGQKSGWLSFFTRRKRERSPVPEGE